MSGAKQNSRYYFIDSARGAAIIGVVLYHFLYDLYVVFGLDPLWVLRPATAAWQEGTCCLFIMISGFVWRLGAKSCLRRGLRLNLCGLLITLLTFAFLPSQLILFGILNFMGCAAWIMLALNKLADRLRPEPGVFVGLAIFVLCRHISEGVVGVEPWLFCTLPEALYDYDILLPLGLPYSGFYSSDYFPLLPWFGMFLCGYYLYAYCQRHSWLPKLAYGEIPLLSFAGRNTLAVYLLHQAVCYPLAAMIASFNG